MNPFLGLKKRAELRKKMIILSNEINHEEDIDVLAEIEKDENNPNYQKEDDEMLACLEEIDPLD
jgi:hypothetical protein